MGQSLKEIAKEIKNCDKRIQLIYAFNGTGKTRLSREFKELIDPKENQTEEQEDSKIKILYYNAFTEDLFYWDNDLKYDTDRKLIIRPNGFTDLVLKDQGQAPNIISKFQYYTSDKITPNFNEEYTYKDDNNKDVRVEAYSEVKFSIASGDENTYDNVKISKGEESNFIWCVFFSLFEQIVENLNIENKEERSTNEFDNIEYIFIDDPVTSLDDNHLIALAVDLASLIKSSKSELKFIITTHNALFYNVLYNELSSKECYLLGKNEDASFELDPKQGDSNKSFSYHLHLKNIIEQAVKNNQIEKYHFILLRNLYEKTANFLGYPKWSELLPDDKSTYYNRIIQFTSHSTLSNETVREPTNPEKQVVGFLLNHLITNYNYWKNITE